MQAGETIPEYVTEIHLRTTPGKVWHALTDPLAVKKWMADFDVEVSSDWNEGSPISFRVMLEGKWYTDRGIILKAEAGKLLRYSYWSEVAGLPFASEHSAIFEFRIDKVDDGAMLILAIRDFPSLSFRQHAAVYWPATMRILKKFLEG